MDDVDIFDCDLGAGRYRPVAATSSRFRHFVKGGSSQGLSFELSWNERGTTPCLSMVVAGSWVWGDEGEGTSISPEPLLRQLASGWNYILFQEVYPLGVTPLWPSDLRSAMHSADLEPVPGEVDKLLRQYNARHNLGCWAESRTSWRRFPGVWLMREGSMMIIDAGQLGRLRWAFADVVRTLQELGDGLSKLLQDRHRLTSLERNAITAWNEREDGEIEDVLAVSIGLPQTDVQVLTKQNLLPLPDNRRDLLKGLDEYQAVARMFGKTDSTETLASVLKILHGVDRSDVAAAKALDELSVAAQACLKEFRKGKRDLAPHLEGQHLANWLRRRLGIYHINMPAKPEEFLIEHGVKILPMEVESSVDAVCVWKPGLQPCILINSRGSHVKGSGKSPNLSGGGRATLAHEICHLLIDRGQSMPVVEVLGGSMPKYLEQRAGAFAAQFLVPMDFAAEAWRSEADLESTISKICNTYQVTKSVAATQLLNWGRDVDTRLSEQDQQMLRRISRFRQ